MQERTHAQAPKHDPRAWNDDDNQRAIPRFPRPRTPQPGSAYPAAPLNFTAQQALLRLELRLAYPTDLIRATTRYEVASERTAQLSAWMDRRDLTAAEFTSLEFAQDVMRESRTALATAGRLDLIGAGAPQ